jgi:hypothetical protein
MIDETWNASLDVGVENMIDVYLANSSAVIIFPVLQLGSLSEDGTFSADDN